MDASQTEQHCERKCNESAGQEPDAARRNALVRDLCMVKGQAEEQGESGEGRHDVVRQLSGVEKENEMRGQGPRDEEGDLRRRILADEAENWTNESDPRKEAEKRRGEVVEGDEFASVEDGGAPFDDVFAHADVPESSTGGDQSRDPPSGDDGQHAEGSQ